MVIALLVIVLLVVALVVAGVVLTRTRRELVEAQDRIAAVEGEQAETARVLDEERATREARESDLDERDGQLDDARRDLATAEGRADTAEGRAETAEKALRDAHDRLEAVIEESTSVSATLEAVRAELATTSLALEHASDGGDASALWALEIARSERRWQLSVAPGIDLPSPFDDTIDALKLAVEVEASALREEVGTEIDVAWGLDGLLPDEASLLVLRLAQELLADAAARGETLELRVGPEDDGVALELRALDEEGTEVAVLLPELSSGRVRPSETGGWVVTRA